MSRVTAKRIAISAVLGAYILSAVIAGAYPSPLTSAWGNYLKTALSYWGLYHSYSMFAPDPIRYNQTFRALITFKDGSKTIWKFPSLPDFKDDDLVRQRKLPWVEWECYFAFDPSDIIIVEDAARYVAWMHRNPSNQPLTVEILRDYQNIKVDARDKVTLEPVVTESVLRYPVSEDDLK